LGLRRLRPRGAERTAVIDKATALCLSAAASVLAGLAVRSLLVEEAFKMKSFQREAAASGLVLGF